MRHGTDIIFNLEVVSSCGSAAHWFAVLRYTKDEIAVIRSCDTPEKVQEFLLGMPYNFDEPDETWRSFRGVMRGRTAHCFEGAVFAAAVLAEHGYPPLLMCMEASDIDHNIFVYRKGGRFGSVAKSRDQNLLGRPPKFRSLRSLVMSYHPYYFNYFTNDLTDLTLRGYGVVDLSTFGRDWVLAEGNLTFIVEHLWAMPYVKLFPADRAMYSGFPEVGKSKYLSPKEKGGMPGEGAA